MSSQINLLYRNNKILSGGGNVKRGLTPTATGFIGSRVNNNLNRAAFTKDIDEYGNVCFIEYDGSVTCIIPAKEIIKSDYIIDTVSLGVDKWGGDMWGYSSSAPPYTVTGGNITPNTITGKKVSTVGGGGNVTLIIKGFEISPNKLTIQIYNSTNTGSMGQGLVSPGPYPGTPEGGWFNHIDLLDSEGTSYKFYPYDGVANPDDTAKAIIKNAGVWTEWTWLTASTSLQGENYNFNITQIYNYWKQQIKGNINIQEIKY